MKRFKLAWRKPSKLTVVQFTRGLTRFHSREEAGFQAILFQSVFQGNVYHVEEA